MKAIPEVPIPECCVKLYLTLEDVERLKCLRYNMITRKQDKEYLNSNTAYVLLDTILSALGVNNENS